MNAILQKDLEFDEKAHLYRFRGEVVQSVTQVLVDNEFIETDYFTEDGRIRGTRVHMLCEQFDLGTMDKAWARQYELDGYVESWRKLKVRLGMEILDVERRMAHSKYLYAGSPDRRADIRHRPWVIDIKTGPKADWHGYQTGGYEELYLANAETGPFMRGGAHLKADGALAELIPHEDMHDRHHFLSFVDTTNQRRLHGKSRSKGR